MGGGAGFRGYWDAHEEELLRRGVQRHGIGSWERIRHDVEFRLLKGRTGVQLKDKWRNLVKFQHVGVDEAGRAPVRSYRSGGFRRRGANRGSKAGGGEAAGGRGSSGGEEDDEGPPVRSCRALAVREPEPVNDFERARLENIRRNQEALAALMGGVSALTPKEAQPAPAARRSRARPAPAENEAVRDLREQKAAAEARRHALLSQLDEADAAITAAESAFARGMGSEEAMEAAISAKAATRAALGEAEKAVADAVHALHAAVAQQAEQAAAARRLARAEAQTPERASARVASRPKKSYAEDDAGSDGELGRDGLGRVIEDRRYGIYDARRYRMQGEGEEEEDEEQKDKAVVVKSYRDSATFKRRHGLPLDEEAAEASGGDMPAALTVGASRRRVASAAPEAGGSRKRAAAMPDPAEPCAQRRGREHAGGGLPEGGGKAVRRFGQGSLAQPTLPLSELEVDPMPQWGRRAPRTALKRALEDPAPAPHAADFCRARRHGLAAPVSLPAALPAVVDSWPLPTVGPASSYGAEEPHALVDVPEHMRLA